MNIVKPPPRKEVSQPSVAHVSIHRVRGQEVSSAQDLLAVEEPLEIRLAFKGRGEWMEKSISITMRTPGNDFELAAGFLLTEGIVQGPHDIQEIQSALSPDGQPTCNRVRVQLRSGLDFDAQRFERHFYTTSSCGVCGKTSLEALAVQGCRPLPVGQPRISCEVVQRLGERLHQDQTVFHRTGGLHAAGLFDAEGSLVSLHEDVGRHNAVDKVVGEQLSSGRIPLHNYLLMVSGRASFEIVQKAVVAGIPIIAAVSAPSSLAVDLARQFNLTLLGFVRENRFNLYTGLDRVQLSDSPVVAI